MCDDQTMQTTTELLGTLEAATLLGIDRATLTRWVEAEKVRTVGKIGGAYVFSRADIDALAALRATA